MRQSFLSEDAVVVVDGPEVAATTAVDSTIVDMAGYEGCLFIAVVGTPAANNNLRVRQDSDAAMGSAADLEGTLVNDGGTDSVLAVDIKSPRERYIRARVTRGTSSTVDSIVAIKYGARKKAVTQTSAVTVEKHIAPAEGTA